MGQTFDDDELEPDEPDEDEIELVRTSSPLVDQIETGAIGEPGDKLADVPDDGTDTEEDDDPDDDDDDDDQPDDWVEE